MGNKLQADMTFVTDSYSQEIVAKVQGQSLSNLVGDTISQGNLPTCKISKAYQKRYSPDMVCYG